MWSCNVCTLENHPSVTECEACNAPRSVVGTGTGACPELDFPDQECRLVLVGKSGNGKSSLGNTLLGFECFECTLKTTECKHHHTQRFGIHLKVADTPGWFSTALDQSAISNEITKCLGVLAPGPHAIILVIRLGQFSKEESEAVEEVLKLFGFHLLHFLVIVFTHGDELKARSEAEKEQEVKKLLKLLEDAPSELRMLLDQVNHRYVVIDNTADRSAKDRQVRQLLVTVKDLVHANGGDHFTSDTTGSREETTTSTTIRKIVRNLIFRDLSSEMVERERPGCSLM